MTYYLALNRRNEADGLVKSCHYSGRPPANVQIVGTWHTAGGLFGDAGPCVAACYFSIPPTRWGEPVLELTRLVRHDDHQLPLTKLISEVCAWIKRKGMIDLVVSFADPTFGHHGGVYQAASWNYGGRRERRMDGLVIGGVFYPGRTCNSLFGTQSPDKLRAMKPDETIEPHYDEGKHLYWRTITKNGERKANRLKLDKLPYPKPAADAVRDVA